MKCNALLGVGQGSTRGSYIVTMEWRGNKNNPNPLLLLVKESVSIQEVYL